MYTKHSIYEMEYLCRRSGDIKSANVYVLCTHLYTFGRHLLFVKR